MSLLEVRGLVKRFGGLVATNHVDLTVEAGSVHSIIGPNGAGKSTLLNQLIGGLQPDEGTIMFDGQSLVGRPAYEIHQLGIARVFQSPEIYPEMTLIDNVTVAVLATRDGSFSFNMLQHPKKRRGAVADAEAALAEVGLADYRHHEARHLSRGDKRRLEFAICLAHRPRLLLLDEPTAGMSQHETSRIVELLARLSGKEMANVIIEHDVKLVFSLSDHVTVLQQGTVIADGEPAVIREDERVLEAYLGGVEEA